MKRSVLVGLCMGAALAFGGCGNDAGETPSTGKCEDAKCPDGQHCVDGACAEIVAACEDAAQKLCGESCKDVQNDVANCGDCGHACEDGERCEGGTCKADVVEPCEDAAQERCNGTCTDLKTDAQNCGACGTACVGGKKCDDGNCVLVCENGQEKCEDSCVDLKTDSRNCGGCGNVCQNGMTCDDGACHPHCVGAQVICEVQCAEDDANCAGEVCADLKADASNCGKCGKACDPGLFCVDGECGIICPSSQSVCGDICVSLKTDDKNCGECGNVCDKGDVCRQGVCEPFCPEGQKECDGQCYDLQSTFSNCGACGHACEEGQFCNGGKCLKDCGEERLGCDGNCIDANTDANYCGAKGSCSEDSLESENSKGVKCDGGQVCRDGACVCDAEGQTACLVAENTHLCTDASKDDAYCGCNAEKAGVNCSTLDNAKDGHCESSVCKFECKDGFASCDEEADNGCETNLNEDVENCGACGNPCLAENASEIVCKFGACEPTCKEGFVACGGKCVSLKSNENCGACGNACGEGAVCSDDGFCVVKECTLEDGDYAAVKVGDKTVKAYCVRDIANFKEVRSAINLGKPYPNAKNTDNAYILMKNIDLEEQASWAGAGTSANPFTGYYFGNGKKVTGTLTCSSSNCGLFGYISGALITGMQADLTYTNASVDNVGGIVGYADKSTVSRCETSGTVKAANYAGGIVGMAKDSIFEKNISNCDVYATQYQGGIIGSGQKVEITDCASHGKILNQNGYAAAGIGAELHDSVVTRCIATGDVFGASYNIGGLAGYSERTKYIDSKSSGTVTTIGSESGGFGGDIRQCEFVNCESTGDVISNSSGTTYQVGGFVGMSTSGSSYKNCIAKGKVTVKNAYYIGGFAGEDSGGSFENCSAEGSANGNNNVGGFVGYVSASASFKSCTAKGDASSAGERVGGFAGGMFSSTAEDCRASGTATGLQYVGGHTGYSDNSTFTDCHATGNVSRTENSTGSGFAGFVGYLNNSTITGCTSAGDTSGYYWSSSFAGMVRGTNKFTRCASFGSVTTCTNNCNSGGLVGGFNGTVTLDTCFTTGNETGGYAGGLIGNAEAGTALISDSYCTGTPSGGTKQGAIVGNQSATVTVKNVYWWQGGRPNAGNANFGANSTHTPFIYKESKAVVAENNDAPLADMLNLENDSWVSQTCMLSTGPGTANVSKYVIPVLKGMKVPFCE